MAYAQSWSLVYFLMQDDRRDAFLNFIRAYRDAKTGEPITDHAGRLYKSLRTDPEDFETDWRAFLARF